MPLSLERSLALKAGDQARLKRLINDAKWSLNFMHGEFARPAAAASTNYGRAEKVTILQTEVQQNLEARCLESLVERCAHPPRQSLRRLLKGRSPYTNLSTTCVAPVEVSRIALPTGSLGGCKLEMNVAEQDRKFLAGDGSALLRPEPQVRALNEALGEANPYMDERMGRSKRVYAQVIKKCQAVGILTLTTSAKSINGVFLSNGKIHVYE